MKRQLSVWRLIKDSLEKNIPVMLLLVLESKGSSPGRQGFLMAVNHDGEMQGSIGGGIMEHKLVELAKEQLARYDKLISPAVKKQVHDKKESKNQSGMICSGEQTVLLYPVLPSDLQSVSDIVTFLEVSQTHSPDSGGSLHISPRGIKFIPENLAIQYDYKSDDHWQFLQPLGYRDTMYIVGGGHCGLALSRMMADLDFFIHLVEDRPDLNTWHSNTFANRKTIIGSYSDLASIVLPGPDKYVVIMTFGYRTDDLAFRALMQQQFAYLGILGSQSKIDKMFETYRNEGIAETTLNSVHAPIGLSIKSETPEEIAVSIAAEIIGIRNSRH